MPSFQVKVSHEMTINDALARIKNGISTLKGEYAATAEDFQEHWEGSKGEYQITAYGLSIRVLVHVNPADVTVDGDLPFLAIAFKGRIEEELRKMLEQILEK